MLCICKCNLFAVTYITSTVAQCIYRNIYYVFTGSMQPAHIGVPLGEAWSGSTYFMLEVHYNNPNKEISKSIYIYTDKYVLVIYSLKDT